MKSVFTVGVPFIYDQLRFPFACVTAVSHVCCCISDRNKGNENVYLIFKLGCSQMRKNFNAVLWQREGSNM